MQFWKSPAINEPHIIDCIFNPPIFLVIRGSFKNFESNVVMCLFPYFCKALNFPALVEFNPSIGSHAYLLRPLH